MSSAAALPADASWQPAITDYAKGRHGGGAASERLRDLWLAGQGRHRRAAALPAALTIRRQPARIAS
ncbi:hypothetical protein ACFYWN_37740 [Streptomyces sp. NPDC002917]|uniref:hypothetical protein n=1 Tax=Streptomyces sp. NPDC002917 TaxID=3364671 RepID=UPI0036A43A92